MSSGQVVGLLGLYESASGLVGMIQNLCRSAPHYNALEILTYRALRLSHVGLKMLKHLPLLLSLNTLHSLAQKRSDERFITIFSNNSIKFLIQWKQVTIAAAKHLTPVTLELGGKDPAIILPGTDIRKWLSLWMRGVLWVLSQST